MRLIKYRAWDKRIREFFIESALLFDILKETKSETSVFIFEQFTGRQDNQGVGIYEGDNVWDGNSGFYEVCWDVDSCGFVLSSASGMDIESFSEYDMSALTIVGNIHQGKTPQS